MTERAKHANFFVQSGYKKFKATRARFTGNPVHVIAPACEFTRWFRLPCGSSSAAARALFQRGQNLFLEGRKIAVFFNSARMLGSFVLELRKLLATSKAEFNSPVVAGIGSNPVCAGFCRHILSLFWFIAF